LQFLGGHVGGGEEEFAVDVSEPLGLMGLKSIRWKVINVVQKRGVIALGGRKLKEPGQALQQVGVGDSHRVGLAVAPTDLVTQDLAGVALDGQGVGSADALASSALNTSWMGRQSHGLRWLALTHCTSRVVPGGSPGAAQGRQSGPYTRS